MPFKEKAIVRHRLRPDWGVGRVLMRSEEYLQIDFTAGGLKKLKTVIADEHLLAATDDEFKASKPAGGEGGPREGVRAEGNQAEETDATHGLVVAAGSAIIDGSGRSGGTGRRAGLKIPYSQECVGSTPSSGTTLSLNQGRQRITTAGRTLKS